MRPAGGMGRWLRSEATDDPGRRGPRDEVPQVTLVVPLQRAAAVSPRRTRTAIVAWLLVLSGIAAFGLVSHLTQEASPTTVAAATAQIAEALLAPTPLPRRNEAASRGPRPTPRHALGEDGLMGGIVFGSNIPRLTQAELERDGYRYFAQLLARDAGRGQLAPR